MVGQIWVAGLQGRISEPRSSTKADEMMIADQEKMAGLASNRIWMAYKSMHMDLVGIIIFHHMLCELLKCYYILALPCIQGIPKKSGLPSGTPSFLRMS